MSNAQEHTFTNLPFLLVTGIGRSGTTALTKCLMQHSRIFSNGVESNVFFDVMQAAHGGCTIQSRKRQMVRSQEEYNAIFRQSMLQLLFDDSQDTAVGCKAYSTFSAMAPETADYVKQVFTQIRFLNIIRDGIEVVSSRMSHRVFGTHSFEQNCEVWNRCLHMVEWGMDHECFVLIRHEWLLDRSKIHKVFQSLFEPIQLSDPSPCCDYLLANRKNATNFPGEQEQRAQRLESRKERWNLWSDEQKSIFKDLCGGTMSKLGYEIPTA